MHNFSYLLLYHCPLPHLDLFYVYIPFCFSALKYSATNIPKHLATLEQSKLRKHFKKVYFVTYLCETNNTANNSFQREFYH